MWARVRDAWAFVTGRALRDARAAVLEAEARLEHAQEMERHKEAAVAEAMRHRNSVIRLRAMVTTAQEQADRWEHLTHEHVRVLEETRQHRQEALEQVERYAAALCAVANLVEYVPAPGERLDLAGLLERVGERVAPPGAERALEERAAALQVLERYVGRTDEPRSLAPFLEQHLAMLKAARDSLVRIACALGYRTNIREVDPEHVEGYVYLALEALEAAPGVSVSGGAWPRFEVRLSIPASFVPAYERWVWGYLKAVVERADLECHPKLRKPRSATVSRETDR